MSFPVHAEYRSTKDEWLGDLPSHWQLNELKYVSSVLTSNVDKKSVEGQESVRLCNYTDVYYNDTIHPEIEFMPATATKEQITKFTLRSGDVLITKDSETADDIAVSAYVPQDLPGIVCGYHLAIIRPSAAVSGNFIKRLFDSSFIRSRVATLANGLTRVGLGQGAIGGLKIPLPPLPEQRAIAAFLDAETSKIDALVAEQRRLIELLKEKRQAVISHAVTKGLNPHVKMKPSGIDWLGDVPEHWEVKALKHIGTICYGIGEPPTYYDDGVPLIRATNVKSGSLSPSGLVFVKPKQIPSQRIVWLQSGNIIVVRSGAGTGDSAIVPEDYGPAIAGFDMVLQVRFASPWYVQYSLLSDFVTKAQLDIVKTRAAQPHLNAQELGSCLIPLPPTKEQQEIVGFLSEQIQGFNELEKSAENGIALLQERRTALISAAVTGKIDVRDFVAKEASA